MATQHGRRVIGVRHGGAIQHHKAVRFDFTFEDQTQEPFHTHYEDMPKIINAMAQFAAITERARNAIPGQPFDVVMPYRLKDSVTGIATNGAIAMRLATLDGLPLEIAMTREQAQKLHSQIDGALRQKPEAYGRH